jgi:hypothetical protein
MFEQHREQFMHFMLLNNAYADDKMAFKQQFDEEGRKIKEIVLDWEDRLCRKMEGGDNSSYSAKLGDKFQEEVTKYFPFYHEIGVAVRKVS